MIQVEDKHVYPKYDLVTQGTQETAKESRSLHVGCVVGKTDDKENETIPKKITCNDSDMFYIPTTLFQTL